MASLTEITLFKSCVENPLVLKNLGDLNMEKISNPTNAADLNPAEF